VRSCGLQHRAPRARVEAVFLGRCARAQTANTAPPGEIFTSHRIALVGSKNAPQLASSREMSIRTQCARLRKGFLKERECWRLCWEGAAVIGPPPSGSAVFGDRQAAAYAIHSSHGAQQRDFLSRRSMMPTRRRAPDVETGHGDEAADGENAAFCRDAVVWRHRRLCDSD
jgi:hypothetical protein